MSRVPSNIKDIARQKASNSGCTYRVSAIAFDRKGDILGTASNKHAVWNVVQNDPCGRGRRGTARHAERILCAKYGKHIKTIVICRVGKSGELRPIDPCPTCAKVAAKMGVKIVSIKTEDGD